MDKIRTPEQEAQHQINIQKYYTEMKALHTRKYQLLKKLITLEIRGIKKC